MRITINDVPLDDQQADIVHTAVRDFTLWLESEYAEGDHILQHFRRRAREIVDLMEAHARA
jgi:hypothetical protein